MSSEISEVTLSKSVTESDYFNEDLAPTKLSERTWGTGNIAALWVYGGVRSYLHPWRRAYQLLRFIGDGSLIHYFVSKHSGTYSSYVKRLSWH